MYPIDVLLEVLQGCVNFSYHGAEFLTVALLYSLPDFAVGLSCACRMLNRSHQLDASTTTPFPQVVITKNVSRNCQRSPGGKIARG